MANRTTFRMNLGEFLGNDQHTPRTPKPVPEGTVYHILTESPSLKDYTGFGPFHCIEATVESILDKLQRVSMPGFRAFTEVLSQWCDGSVVQMKAPLGDGNHITIRLIEEHNPAVAAALPGPAWTVRRSIFKGAVVQQLRYTDFDIVGSYLDKEQAFKAAREKMDRLLVAE